MAAPAHDGLLLLLQIETGIDFKGGLCDYVMGSVRKTSHLASDQLEKYVSGTQNLDGALYEMLTERGQYYTQPNSQALYQCTL